MCIYTLKEQNKNSQEGCANPPKVPKLGVSGVIVLYYEALY